MISRQWAVVRQKLSHFLPMCLLFFFMAFNNTIFDSTKDTLLITAVGGAEQVPFVTLYAVLPCSCLFLFLFTLANTRFSRRAVFNFTVFVYMTFFWTFSALLYPNRHILHSAAVANALNSFLPVGLSALGNMIHQWTFTIFYVMSELWGDVILSLNFWVLANETTRTEDAIVLYPLFGIGANVAQLVAGQTLRHVQAISGQVTYQGQLQFLTNLTVGVSIFIWAIHHWITDRFTIPTPAKPAATSDEKKGVGEEGEESDATLGSSLRLILGSPVLQCLAAISLAQGITTNLIEVAWKASIRLLHPDPSSYSAFMGGVSSMLGVCTGLAMVVSPTIFLRATWRQAASVNPTVNFYGGSVFFAVIIGGFVMGVKSTVFLSSIVLMGTLLYMFGRASKFSLLKPAEEMVYLRLDETSRRSGKAAIEVVGSQVGKSISSLMQQLFLLFGSGKLQRTYPMMWGLLLVVGVVWMNAVTKLSKLCFESGGNAEGDHTESGSEAKEGTTTVDIAPQRRLT